MTKLVLIFIAVLSGIVASNASPIAARSNKVAQHRTRRDDGNTSKPGAILPVLSAGDSKPATEENPFVVPDELSGWKTHDVVKTSVENHPKVTKGPRSTPSISGEITPLPAVDPTLIEENEEEKIKIGKDGKIRATFKDANEPGKIHDLTNKGSRVRKTKDEAEDEDADDKPDKDDKDKSADKEADSGTKTTDPSPDDEKPDNDTPDDEDAASSANDKKKAVPSGTDDDDTDADEDDTDSDTDTTKKTTDGDDDTDDEDDDKKDTADDDSASDKDDTNASADKGKTADSDTDSDDTVDAAAEAEDTDKVKRERKKLHKKKFQAPVKDQDYDDEPDNKQIKTRNKFPRVAAKKDLSRMYDNDRQQQNRNEKVPRRRLSSRSQSRTRSKRQTRMNIPDTKISGIDKDVDQDDQAYRQPHDRITPHGPIAQFTRLQQSGSLERLSSDPDKTEPWEEPKMISNCWLQEMLSTHYKFSPNCNQDGTFGPKQCYRQRCWCVHRDGSPQEPNPVKRFHYVKEDDISALTLECTQNRIHVP